MRAGTILPSTESDTIVRIDLVSGFRGGGKTSFICALESVCWNDERVVILQNETGKRSIRTGALRPGHAVEQWRGGCICCTAPALFEEALSRILSQYAPQRIVIEMAETELISGTKAVLEHSVRGSFQIDHCFYVVSGTAFPSKWEQSRGFMQRQLEEKPAVLVSGPDARTITEWEVLGHAAAQGRLLTHEGSGWDADALRAFYVQGKVFRKIVFRPRGYRAP